MDPLREEAIFNERHVKIICIGAGASGLCFAYKLQRSFRNYSLTIYEKNPEIGGTWFENRYPGCACDVPSHNYAYSFEPKHDWTSVYASSAEIKTYFQDFARKYGLRKFLRTLHVVRKAQWLEEDGKWEVEVHDLATGQVVRDSCHFLIHACGYLNKPAWPKLPGLDEYKGIKLHSADYDETVSLEEKKVILIGNGSSAAQILPAIQPIVKQVKIFIRSPLWLLPDISSGQRHFTPEEIRIFKNDPTATLELRKLNETTMNSIFSVYLRDSSLQAECRALLSSEMKKVLQDETMEKKLIPTFFVGCKRVVPSGLSYLKALLKDNVTMVHSGVASFTETGCTSEDGTFHSGEVIICATGFDTSYIPHYPIIGPNGRNMQDEWAKCLTSYMGVAVAEFPNMFTFLGPYSPVSNGPTLIAIEAQADYILHFLDRYQTTPTLQSVSPTRSAVSDFLSHTSHFMSTRSVWTDHCRSSHNNHSIGLRTPTTWPGSTLHYLEALREPRPDDWHFVHRGNRFDWLGPSGISQAEWDPTCDLAYYIRGADDGRWATWWRRNQVVSRSGSRPERKLHRQGKLTGTREVAEGKMGREEEDEEEGEVHEDHKAGGGVIIESGGGITA
ncbi:hypothetical protein GJ744_010124 [Endocarpon pusillum]|uniref:Uncharacterized protein n=1 Tax=Endocarpon pusillum TaxID=364733 RepID=A0A8H7E4G7_9EURO|nr:hypothetical protein GJ744_010124 [Endocarpon pusillum]